MNRICVFCGSSRSTAEVYAQAAHDLGRQIARRGYELVYGGENVCLMGAGAAIGVGGGAIGVIPESRANRD